MLHKKKNSLIFVVVTLLYLKSFSQSNLGVSGLLDKSALTSTNSFLGISFEKFLNKKSSVEIGIFYRTFLDKELPYYFGPTTRNGNPVSPLLIVHYSVKHSFLSVPILYNYKTEVVNVSIGASLDFFLKWSEKAHTIDTVYTPTLVPSTMPPFFIVWIDELEKKVKEPLTFYKFDNSILIGMILKVSKPIFLNKKLAIEPNVFFNPIFTKYSVNNNYNSTKRTFYGAGLSVKYTL